MPKKTPAQLDREIAEALGSRRTTSHIGRYWTNRMREVRDELDVAGGTLDAEMDPMAIAQIADDAYASCDKDAHKRLLANIPPVVLGKTKYRVVHGGRHGLDLVGPRGGSSSLVISRNDPKVWAHNTSGGSSVKTVWYRRNPDYTFTRIE